MHHRKASAMSNAALISAGDTRRFLVAAAVNHCNDTVRYRRADGKFDAVRRGYLAVAVTSTSEAIAAPTIPAVFRRVAGTTGVRFASRGIHFSALRLLPPPAMNRSGQIAFSMATRTLVTSLAQRS